jgi:hypothetical protein
MTLESPLGRALSDREAGEQRQEIRRLDGYFAFIRFPPKH